MAWTLDYDEKLVLNMGVDDSAVFASSGFFKLSVKRYVSSVEIGQIIFKNSLTYLDYKKIIGILKRKYPDIVVSSRLASYIDGKEMYVDKRSKLGIELKKHDPKLLNQFYQYKAVVNDAFVRPLREQQMWDSFYLCAMKKASNFSVPGSGKTASVIGMYAYLKAKSMVNKILVICPKNAFGSWMDEFEACFGNKEPLKALNIHDTKYKNQADRSRAIKYESGMKNLILVNYESVGGVEDALLEIIDSKVLLVFDEVHKVKRVGGEHAGHALSIAEKASYVVALTGTPIPNSYADIYNLFHILFPDEYDTFFNFSLPVLNSPTLEEIACVNDKLQPFFCRTTKEQLGVPAPDNDNIYMNSAGKEENRILHLLKMNYRNNKLALMIRILQMESNPELLLRKLDLSDFKYLLDDSVEIEDIDFHDYSDELKKLINNCPASSKFNNCVGLAEELVSEHKTVIIWCIFVESIESLSRALERRGIRTCKIYGEVPLEERQMILDKFRNGTYQVLLTNPHTLAESVSLHSVCHDAIYFEYSYNLVHLLQSKDRIHRLGLPENQYTRYYYMQVEYMTIDGPWSMDAAIYDRLRMKEQTMLEAIDRHELETMPTTKEDLDLIFNKLFK